MLREVKEETGLDARNAEGGYLFTYKRENPGEGDNYFVDVYRFVMMYTMRTSSCRQRKQTAAALQHWTKSKHMRQKENSCITTASARHLSGKKNKKEEKRVPAGNHMGFPKTGTRLFFDLGAR